MRYSTKHGPSKRRNALANPVAKAIAVRQIQQHLRNIQTLAYVLDDGEDAPDQLGHMAWIIGLGAEVAFAVQSPHARRLHGALRTVHAMALGGYRWQAQQAPVVDAALGESAALITGHADIAWTMLAGAEWIAHRISTRTTRADDVAGAELYATPPAGIAPLAPPARGGEGARQKAEGEDGQQAPAGPEGLAACARLAASAGEVMDEGQARQACPALASCDAEGAC